MARDHAWIDAPVPDDRGEVVQTRGVTPSPGSYVVGLPWMHTRGSALLGWVHADARHVADRLASRVADDRDRPGRVRTARATRVIRATSSGNSGSDLRVRAR